MPAFVSDQPRLPAELVRSCTPFPGGAPFSDLLIFSTSVPSITRETRGSRCSSDQGSTSRREASVSRLLNRCPPSGTDTVRTCFVLSHHLHDLPRTLRHPNAPSRGACHRTLRLPLVPRGCEGCARGHGDSHQTLQGHRTAEGQHAVRPSDPCFAKRALLQHDRFVRGGRRNVPCKARWPCAIRDLNHRVDHCRTSFQPRSFSSA